MPSPLGIWLPQSWTFDEVYSIRHKFCPVEGSSKIRKWSVIHISATTIAPIAASCLQVRSVVAGSTLNTTVTDGASPAVSKKPPDTTIAASNKEGSRWAQLDVSISCDLSMGCRWQLGLTSSAGGHLAQWKLLVFFWETMCPITYKQLALSGTHLCYWSVPSGARLYLFLLFAQWGLSGLAALLQAVMSQGEGGSWVLILLLRKVRAFTELFFKEPCNQVNTPVRCSLWNNSANYPVAFSSRFKGKILTDVPSLRRTKWQLMFYEGMRSPLPMLLSIGIWKQTDNNSTMMPSQALVQPPRKNPEPCGFSLCLQPTADLSPHLSKHSSALGALSPVRI